VLFAMPPLLTTTYVGIRGVDRDVVDAARGMGMGPWQLLWRVEVPLAKPLIITGLRLAAVQVVATVTLAAFVAGGGLGRIIASGYGRQDDAQLVAGALLVAALALTTELGLLAWQRRATPTPTARPD
jgi:osmoprotectant transport system permease protein